MTKTVSPSISSLTDVQSPLMGLRSLFDGVLNVSASYWGSGVALVAGMVTRTLVTPAAFGGTSYVRGIQGYLSTYNNLYRHIIGREVPARRARGEMKDADLDEFTKWILQLVRPREFVRYICGMDIEHAAA